MREERKTRRLGKVLLVSTVLAVCAAAVCRLRGRKGCDWL